jgi:gluconolactonase
MGPFPFCLSQVSGLAFSPDEKKLYIANSRPAKFWMVYDVKPSGALVNGLKFFDMSNDTGEAVPDGMKIDSSVISSPLHRAVS